MNVAIIGSRDYPDLYSVYGYVAGLPNDTRVISGGATGVDTAAAMVARRRATLSLTVYRPDYQRYGKQAPLIRNQSIIEAADRVVAFWDGKSRGTMHAVGIARRLGKPVEIITCYDEVR